MRRTFLRLVSSVLVLSFIFTSSVPSAHAMRGEAPKETGLEEKLARTLRGVARTLGLSDPSAPSAPSTGLEEGGGERDLTLGRLRGRLGEYSPQNIRFSVAAPIPGLNLSDAASVMDGSSFENFLNEHPALKEPDVRFGIQQIASTWATITVYPSYAYTVKPLADLEVHQRPLLLPTREAVVVGSDRLTLIDLKTGVRRYIKGLDRPTRPIPIYTGKYKGWFLFGEKNRLVLFRPSTSLLETVSLPLPAGVSWPQPLFQSGENRVTFQWSSTPSFFVEVDLTRESILGTPIKMAAGLSNGLIQVPRENQRLAVRPDSMILFDPQTGRVNKTIDGLKIGSELPWVSDERNVVVAEPDGLARVNFKTGKIIRVGGLKNPRSPVERAGDAAIVVADDEGLAVVNFNNPADQSQGRIERRVPLAEPPQWLEVIPAKGNQILLAGPSGLSIATRTSAGLEEGVRNPYVRGIFPPPQVWQARRLNVQTTDYIAAGVYAKGHVGGNDRDATDGLGQDIFDGVHHRAKKNARYYWFEGSKHTVYTGEPEYGVHKGGQATVFKGATGEVAVLADVVENTGATIRGQQDPSGAGGTSFYLTGPLMEAFGDGMDELSAAILIGAVPTEKMREFLPSQGGLALDPDIHLAIQGAERLLAANGVTWRDARVFYQVRDRSKTDLLEPLQALAKLNPGMELRQVKDGTADGGLLSILGSKDGKYNLILGTVGSTEGVAKYLMALAMDGVAVGFRLYSPLAKNVGDAAGSLSKTLGELSAEQVARVKKVARLDDEAYEALPKDVPIRYLFKEDHKSSLHELRSEDAEEIVSYDLKKKQGGKLFHNETLTFPRKPSDPPGIRLHDQNGEVIKLIPNVQWNNLILSASVSVILASRTLDLVGPETTAPGEYQVEHLVIERSDGVPYVWVGPGKVTWEELTQVASEHFAGPAPSIQAPAGLEEAPAPVIGYFSKLRGNAATVGTEANFSRQLISGRKQAKGQATKDLKAAVDTILKEQGHRASTGAPQRPLYQKFDVAFGRLLRLSQGNMEIFADTFLRLQDLYDAQKLPQHKEALLQAVKRLAQDPGAPYNQPPVSYYNPARYVYARLRQEALNGFSDEVLLKAVAEIQKKISGRDLSDLQQKAAVVESLQETLGSGRLSQGSYQYEIFYDSLVEKNGERYLTLELLLDGEKDYREGVILELQVVISSTSQGLQYHGPYPFHVPARLQYHVNLLDSIHFINTRFPEWRPKAQRDIYESRLTALKEKGVKRQILRPSTRQGNNPRFFEPFFRAYLVDDAPLAYHIVHTRSEREYGGQGGVPSIGNLASAVVRRGGLGVTATWLLEDPNAAQTLGDRQLVYSYELDHHRVDNTKDVEGYAADLEYLLSAYQEAFTTGWVSANLQDETKFENVGVRDAWIKGGTSTAQTGVIDERTLQALESIYVAPVQNGIPGSLPFHWLRNRILKRYITELNVPVGGVSYDRLYVEPDYALDGKPHTVEEMAFLSLMSWISAQAHGHPLGPVVPSYGNVHGASAGDPNLALAGVHQYAAQAATLYAESVPPQILEIARKAPRGVPESLRQTVGKFKDQTLAEEALRIVGEAGERTDQEEAELHRFVLAQLQRISPSVLKALKTAEQTGRPLSEVSSEIAQQLDRDIKEMPLDRRAAITTHAASGLSAEQLKQAREYGVWVANKSTEFQNIVTKVLHLIYLKVYHPSQFEEELRRTSGARRALAAHPLLDEEQRRTADLYAKMYDEAAAKAIKAAKTDDEREAIRKSAEDPLKPFPWFWRDESGWSMTDENGREWKEYKWAPGDHGRYMFAMRDTMTGAGVDGTLLFPNALTWGLPSTMIQMAQAEIERTIHFYHQPAVMNAVGAAQEYRDFMAAKAGLEEKIQQAKDGLDDPDIEIRLGAVHTLRDLERQGNKLPKVGPELPSYLHVHTDASYHGVPGAFSPTHMVWAAHEAGAESLYLVDHETIGHIQEGSKAAKIVNEGAKRPLRVLFGVEFRTYVDPSMEKLLGALGRGVGGANGGAWVVGMGVPVDSNGQVPAGLVSLVEGFQRAKQRRLMDQIKRLPNLEGEFPLPKGNFTERSIAYAFARAQVEAALGEERPGNELSREATVFAEANSLRRIISQVPFKLEDGFPSYQILVKRLSDLGMIPTFTMQVPVDELEGLIPQLKELGIRALDLAGIEYKDSNAEDKINHVIDLARRNQMLLVGGVDYRGNGAIGWPNKAAWMENPAIHDSLGKAGDFDAQHAGLEEGRPITHGVFLTTGTTIINPDPTHLRRYVVTHLDQVSLGEKVFMRRVDGNGEELSIPRPHLNDNGSRYILPRPSTAGLEEGSAGLKNVPSEGWHQGIQLSRRISYSTKAYPVSEEGLIDLVGDFKILAGSSEAGKIAVGYYPPDPWRGSGEILWQWLSFFDTRSRPDLKGDIETAAKAANTILGIIKGNPRYAQIGYFRLGAAPLRNDVYTGELILIKPETGSPAAGLEEGAKPSDQANDAGIRQMLFYKESLTPDEVSDPNLNNVRFIRQRIARLRAQVMLTDQDDSRVEQFLVEFSKGGINPRQAHGFLKQAKGISPEHPFATSGDVDSIIQEVQYVLRRYPGAGDPVGQVLQRIDRNVDPNGKLGLAVDEVVRALGKSVDVEQLKKDILERFSKRSPEATGLEEAQIALKELNQVKRFWNLPSTGVGLTARPILIDASEDFKVGHLAQALSVMMANDNVPELDFRLVIPAGVETSLIQQLNGVDTDAAEKFLLPRVITYDDQEKTAEDARWEALGALAERFGYKDGLALKSAGVLRVVNHLTPGLAEELEVYFKEGGLLFVSEEAFNRLRAFLEAA